MEDTKEINSLTHLFDGMNVDPAVQQQIQAMMKLVIAAEEKAAAAEEKTAAIEKEKVAAEEKTAAIEKEKVAIEKEKVAAEEKAAAAEEEKNNYAGVGFLTRNGLPRLDKPNIGHSTASYSNREIEGSNAVHYRPDVDIFIPDCCKIENLPKLPSQIWRATTGDGEHRKLSGWNNESSIEHWVRLVLVDVVQLLNLQDEISICNQISLTLVNHLIPDILVFAIEGKLIGICEVKRPSLLKNGDSKSENGDFEKLDPRLINQVTNYLLQLKNVYGVLYPIGVITTYNEWRICFLEEAYSYMLCDNPSGFIQQNSQSLRVEQESQSAVPNTYLCTSKVYKYNDPYLIQILAAMIYKMHQVEIEPLISLVRSSGIESRKFGYIDANVFQWQVLPTDCVNNLTYTMPTSATANFFFIQDYGGGKDGRVWLSLSMAGKLAVVKLSKTSCYKNEARYWNEIWQKEAYTRRLLGANALVMPFVFNASIREGKVVFPPLLRKESTGEYTVDDIRKSVNIPGGFDESLERYWNNPRMVAEEALREMAGKGYKHCDITWRHVGLMPDQYTNSPKSVIWRVKPVLIDLHDAQKLDSNVSQKDVVQQGMDILDDELKNN